MAEEANVSRIVVAVVGVVAVGFGVVGCSSAPESMPVVTETAVAMSTAEKLDIEIPAPFDPTAPGFKLFDPCTELDDETLKAAGIENRIDFDGDRPNSHYCAFYRKKDGLTVGHIGLAGNIAPAQGVERMSVATVFERQYKGNPYSTLYTMSGSSQNECSIAVSTSRGSFHLGFADFDKIYTMEQMCDEAVAKMGLIFPEYKEALG